MKQVKTKKALRQRDPSKTEAASNCRVEIGLATASLRRSSAE